VNDISLAPTQILTPAQMMEYHARRWLQETQHEPWQAGEYGQRDETVHGTDSQGQPQQDVADAPTVYTQNPPDAGEQSSHDIADAPTKIVPSKEASTHAETATADVPQVQAGGRGESVHEEALETGRQEGKKREEPQHTDTNAAYEQGTSIKEEKSMEHTQGPGDTEEVATATAPAMEQQTDQTFPVLSIGTIITNRYEVTQIVKSEQDEHIYEVTDHKGYLYCWNCGSKENTEGDEFCIDCGAELLNVTYLMHEYPATSSSTAVEANVLQANIVDTVIENGHTYAIEQPQTEQSTFVHLLAACDSDAGNLRRSDPNEDSTLVILLERIHESLSSPGGIFLVADGLGGHSNGQYASRVAVNVIADRVVRDLLLAPLSAEKEGEGQKQWDEEALLELLQGSIEDANTAICQINQRDKTDMGCTLTGFMIVGDRAYIFNVGDSRTYMLRDGKIYQLTNDHSLVGQLVAGGLIEPEDVYTHPQRSQIYRSIGDKLNVQIDLFKQQIHPGDMLLSCSDGLWEMVRDPQITEIMTAAPDPQTASTQLIEAANTNGGEDNVSAVVVFVR
jgi:serine/threonine protein phosphatase PrpC